MMPPQTAHRALDEVDAYRQRDCRGVDDCGKQRADTEHEHGGNDDFDDIHDEHENVIGEEVAQLVDVVGDANGNFSCRTVVVVLEGQLLELYENLAAKLDELFLEVREANRIEITREGRVKELSFFHTTFLFIHGVV